MTTAHRLTNVDPQAATATCAVCGPGSRVLFRKHRNRWACRTSDRRRSPEARRRQYEASKARELTRAIDGPFSYADLLEGQGGVCAICDRPCPTGNRLAIDHDHETGRIRGLLCQRCNTALGLMQDDPERLLRAIRYIA